MVTSIHRRRSVPPRTPAPLDVYLGDRRVGTLRRPGSRRLAFEYDAEFVEARELTALSVSLPVRAGRFTNSETRPFFEGLLPEGVVREQVARERGVSPDNSFGLLAEIGAECAGAVVIVPQGENPAPSDTSSVRWLSDDELADLITALPAHPLGGGVDTRVSLGGVQEKLIVTRSPTGVFGQPIGGAPSTHIIKPTPAAWTDIAANEAFCLRVARCAGLRSATSEVMTIADTRCLVVERYDRALTDDMRVVRVHQEDFCQAMGVLPGSKYEFEGGPSVAGVVETLRGVSAAPASDVTACLRAVALNYVLGNSDAHGKNFSLLYDPALGPRLAPLYDVVSTAVYDVTPRMAMTIGGVDEPEAVGTASWRQLAADCGVNATLLLRDIGRVAEAVVTCVGAVANMAAAEGWHRPVIDEICQTVDSRAAQIADSM